MVLTELPRWCNGEESACQCSRHKRHEFDPWIGKITYSREWQPTPIFLPGKFHGQRSLMSYSSWVLKEETNWATEHTHTHTHTHTRETKELTAQCFTLKKQTSPSYKEGNKIFIRILWAVSLQNVNALTSKENYPRQLLQSDLLEKTQSWGWDKMLGV